MKTKMKITFIVLIAIVVVCMLYFEITNYDACYF